MSPPKRRVLCAEPHEDTCWLLTTMLERQGHEVVSAGTLRECLDRAAVEQFDLYMLDDDYIDGTSLELCKQLRRLTPRTPILFFSSHLFAREKALDAGADAYLVKPADIFDIVQTVNSILAPKPAGRASGKT